MKRAVFLTQQLLSFNDTVDLGRADQHLTGILQCCCIWPLKAIHCGKPRKSSDSEGFQLETPPYPKPEKAVACLLTL